MIDKAVGSLACGDVLLEGELVYLDDDGRSNATIHRRDTLLVKRLLDWNPTENAAPIPRYCRMPASLADQFDLA